MKILPVIHTQNYPNDNIRKNYINRNRTSDTFEITTGPSFKNTPAQAAKPALDKVMNAVMCIGGTVLADFVLKLKKDPYGEELMKNPEEAKIAADFVSDVLYSIIAKADYEDDTQNADTSVIEQHETESGNEGSSTVIKETVSEDSIKTTEELSEDKKLFTEFPKKVGRLTANQEKLKAVTSGLKLSDDYTYKLILICQELLTKGSSTIDGAEFDYNELSKILADKLSAEESSKEEIIEKYYECLISKEKPTELIDNNSDEIKIKVLGKIDLPEKNKKPLKDEDCIKNSEFNKKDSSSFTFKIPGNNNIYSLNDILRMILVQFEKNESDKNEDFIKWLYNQPVPFKVYPEDIVDEISKQNKKSDKTSIPYKNITVEDADIIADAINSDDRFKSLFSLHGAVRFFERFIDFEGKNIEEQCKEKLDTLEMLIRKTDATEGITVEKYIEKDKKDQDITGSRIILYPQKFGESFVNILGSFPIIIAICENQPADYYRKKNKQPLIQTIWPVGA